MKFKKLEIVVLTHDITGHGLRTGDVGTVVEVYPTDGVEEYAFKFLQGERDYSGQLLIRSLWHGYHFLDVRFIFRGQPGVLSGEFMPPTFRKYLIRCTHFIDFIKEDGSGFHKSLSGLLFAVPACGKVNGGRISNDLVSFFEDNNRDFGLNCGEFLRAHSIAHLYHVGKIALQSLVKIPK
jgi:hypothetical protein